MKEEHKHSKPGEYQCLQCGMLFRVDGAQLECPKCANHKIDELIPAYVDEDAEEKVHMEINSSTEE